MSKGSHKRVSYGEGRAFPAPGGGSPLRFSPDRTKASAQRSEKPLWGESDAFAIRPTHTAPAGKRKTTPRNGRYIPIRSNKKSNERRNSMERERPP
jgi:hypothetical protein